MKAGLCTRCWQPLMGVALIVALAWLPLGCTDSLDVESSSLQTVSVSPTQDLQTTEGGGQAEFYVFLRSQPVDNVAISLHSDDISEGRPSRTKLNFTTGNWGDPQKIVVTGVNDILQDGDRAYSIVVEAAVSNDPQFNGVDPTDVSLVNVDDDLASVVVSPTSGLLVNEAGGKATFTVVLSDVPLFNVTVPISSGNGAEGSVNPASLLFTPANWSVPQPVEVTGVDDASPDGDVNFSVVVGLTTSTDPLWNGLNPPDVSVKNIDNEGIVIVSQYSRGWYNTQPTQNVGGNTFTGFIPPDDHNSFFAFDLTALAGPYSSVVLVLEHESFFGSDAVEEFSVWDVTTPIAALTGGTGGIAAYNDLQDGFKYGNLTSRPSTVGSTLTLAFNATGVAYVNAALGGNFAVGVSHDSLSGPTATEGGRFSGNVEARIHELWLRP